MLPAELMQQLRYVEVYTTKAVRDHRAGDYRSPLRGRGFEFDQHKRYQQGDDYRRIDWNVTARMPHPYVRKEFEDKEMSALILADLSNSMAFASHDRSKKELLLQIAATAAFSAYCDNMSVGLMAFTDGIELEVPARKGRSHVWHLLESLWAHTPRSPRTDLALPLQELETRLKRSTLIFCLSDFVCAQDLFATHALKRLARRHDFIPLILEDRWEQTLAAGGGYVRLRDPETGEEMLLNLSNVQAERYARALHERKDTLRRGLYRLQIDHMVLRTGEPYLDALLNFFLARRRQQ